MKEEGQGDEGERMGDEGEGWRWRKGRKEGRVSNGGGSRRKRWVSK